MDGGHVGWPGAGHGRVWYLHSPNPSRVSIGQSGMLCFADIVIVGKFMISRIQLCVVCSGLWSLWSLWCAWQHLIGGHCVAVVYPQPGSPSKDQVNHQPALEDNSERNLEERRGR